MKPTFCPALLLACCFFAPTTAVAGETVAVGLASGRVFVGEVDPRTDAEQLWLRTEGPGIVFCRPIRWERILLARCGDQELSSEELQAMSEALKSAPSQNLQDHETLPAPPAPHAAENNPSATGSGFPTRRIANYIQASRAQRYSGAIDRNRCLRGELESNGRNRWNYRSLVSTGLHGLRGSGGWHARRRFDRRAYRQAAGWACPFRKLAVGRCELRPINLAPPGAVFKLPFQGAHPEFDLNIGPFGLVHARLNVPGNGSFETSRSMVRIRQYSNVRDEAQQINGQRFFDVERVDRYGR